MNNLNIDLSNWKGKDEFISDCINRFGAMNKNDYEVALFHLLLINEWKSLSDFEISTKLRIPESKIKRLRYESELNFPSADKAYDKEFINILQTSRVKTEEKYLVFAISDKFFRTYIQDKLHKLGSFYDSSFNSDIVRMSYNDVLLLLASFDINSDKKENKKIIEHIRKGIKENKKELNGDTKDIIEKFLKGILPQAFQLIQAIIMGINFAQ